MSSEPNPFTTSWEEYYRGVYHNISEEMLFPSHFGDQSLLSVKSLMRDAYFAGLERGLTSVQELVDKIKVT